MPLHAARFGGQAMGSEKRPSAKLSENALTTLGDTMVFLGIEESDEGVSTLAMDNIIFCINAFSGYIETQTGRKFGRRRYQERYEGTGGQKLILNHYPVKKIHSIKDLARGWDIGKSEYWMEDGGETGIIYRDGGWPKSGYPSGLANDLAMARKSIAVSYTAGYILPKDGTEDAPSDLPYDLQHAVWAMVQQQWGLMASGAGGLASFSISDVSWTFDKTAGIIVSDVVSRYRRWDC